MTYSKEDLLWEATRRNEVYKAEYKKLHKQYLQAHPSIKTINYLPYPSGHWKIWLAGKGLQQNPSPEYDYKKMAGWMNPDISVDQIKVDIESGYHPFEVHPYYSVFEKAKTSSAFCYYNNAYKPLDSKDFPGFFEREIDGRICVCIDKKYIRDRFLITISPHDSDKKIMEAIKNKKKEIIDVVKNKLATGQTKRSFTITRIDSYIEDLRTYDKLVEECKNSKISMEVINGAYIIPSRQSIFTTVAADKSANIEKELRQCTRQYERSVVMIQNTPDIKFAPSK